MSDDFNALLGQIAEQGSLEGVPYSGRDAADQVADGIEEGLGAASSTTPISRPAIDLLIAAEVSSRSFYEARLVHPVWPKGRSGVTIGIGYDVGTVSAGDVAADWTSELGAAAVGQLASACGVLGQAAEPLAKTLSGVTVNYDKAERVFLHKSVPQFVGTTERALPNTDLIGPDCLGALVSLTYNRGPSFKAAGERFREMRAIHDHMQQRTFDRIPAELRSMKRIWQGDPNSRGLLLRREAEAALFENGLAADTARAGV